MITVDNRSFKEKVEDGFGRAVDYIKKHPYESVFIATTIIGTTVSISKEVNKVKTRRADRFHAEREIYDPNTGSYIQIKRKMDSTDHLAYERLIKNGVGRAEALDMLNLL